MKSLIALGEILWASVPTFLLVWILYFYATRFFFKPLQKTLRKRHDATGGLRERAEANLASAERKMAQYEEALRTARRQLYHQQEQERQRSLDQRAERIRQAQQQVEGMVARAKQEIRQEVEEAKKRLVAETEQIAGSIKRAILEPSMAGPSGSSRMGGSEAGH